MTTTVLLASCLSGCQGQSTDSGLKFAAYEFDEGDVVLDALLDGEVIDAGGCLLVEEATTSTRYVPVLPNTSNAAPRFAPGDKVSLAGGGMDQKPNGATIPAECPSDSWYWIVAPEAE